MKLSVTDIAFEGFRVVRDRPVAVLAWAVLQFLALLAIEPGQFMVSGGFDRFQKLDFVRGMTPGTQPTAAQLAIVQPIMADIFNGGLIVLAVILVVSAVTYPGVYRVAMTPKDRGLFSLKLGMQELRQFLLMLVLSALFFGLTLTGLLASALFEGVFAVGGAAGQMLGLAIGVTATLCVTVYFGVRLSLAGPFTFEQNRIDVFGSWNLTRGRFYGLFGGYVLAGIMAALVYVLSVTIFLAIASVIAGGADKAEALFPDKLKTLADAYTPAQIFGDFYEALVGALVSAILVGARAAAFIQIRKQQPA